MQVLAAASLLAGSASCAAGPSSSASEPGGAAPSGTLVGDDGKALSDSSKEALSTLMGVPFPQAIEELTAFCEAQMPPQIAVRRSVAGYFDDRIEQDLRSAFSRFASRSHSFEYMDFRLNGADQHYSAPRGTVIRFSFANLGDPRCAELDKALPDKGKMIRITPEGKCVALQLSSPDAAEAAVRKRPRKQIKTGSFSYTDEGIDYIDLRTGERLGGSVHWRFDMGAADLSVLLTCSRSQFDDSEIFLHK